MHDHVLVGDAADLLKKVPRESVQTVVTSPPYWGQRDYGHEDQLGLEATSSAYVRRLVKVLAQVVKTLKPDGTLWLNLGDSYHERELQGIPWQVAFALQKHARLRAEVIWSKPAGLPESVKDRPTRSHEHLFLFAKGERYYYDWEAIAEPLAVTNAQRTTTHYDTSERYGAENGGNTGLDALAARMRSGEHSVKNKRSVWTLHAAPYPGAHFAVMPEELARTCILATSRPGDLVLDPFAGSGTTLAVAAELGRKYQGIELNPEYVKLIDERLRPARDYASERENFDLAMEAAYGMEDD